MATKSLTTTQILKELKSLGDPRAIRNWTRMGMKAEKYFGVGLTKLKAYAKKVGKNHELAQELWQSGIHDARVLAVMIEDPRKVTEEQIDRWLSEAEFWDITDNIAHLILPKTAFALKKIELWMKSKNQFVRRCAFMTLGQFAKNGKSLTDDDYMDYLTTIEKNIQHEENWAKEGMNWALILIGSRNKKLHSKALESAKRIGKVEVDYGDTSCKTPDALDILNRPTILSKLK